MIRQPKTLKNRLILYFTLITIVPSIVISIFYYNNARANLENSIVESTTADITYIMDNIEKQLKLAEKFSDFVFSNKSIERILLRSSKEHISGYDEEKRQVMEAISNQKLVSDIGRYILALLIIGDNGEEIRNNNDISPFVNKESIVKTDWFKAGMEQKGRIHWGGVIDNFTEIKTERFMIPIVRPAMKISSNAEIGWTMLGFSADMITDVFKKFKMGPEDLLFVIDPKGICIANKNTGLIGADMKMEAYVREVLGQESGYFVTSLRGEKKLVVFHRSQVTGWTIVEVLPHTVLDNQKNLLFGITLAMMIGSIFITMLFTIYLSSNLTSPLRRLLKRMKEISGGDFQRKLSLEGDDEMGMLGRGINEMAANIESLMQKVVEEESEKRRLELKVLQNQINPHFLYNTLNSIKFMATVQKADGIRDMVSALGNLLRAIFKGNSEKITCREEISILEDYVYIQRIRYKGRIKVFYDIEDETVYNYNIPKFTLQPIVENAIFHGIEPKRGAGCIRIAVKQQEESLLISIEDDGVGMDAQQIEKVFSKCQPEENHRGVSSIGIKNVAERIQLIYGKQYGLEIESVVGEFTRVNICIPREG